MSPLFKIIANFCLNLVFFPFWWYSFGFFEFLIKIKNLLKNKAQALDIGVWLRNIFVPMYGHQDFTGAIISFITRCLQIFFRSIILFLWLIIAIILTLSWLLLPLFILQQLLFQINA